MTDRLTETENWVRTTALDRRAAIAGSVAATTYALAAQPVEAAIRTPATGLDAAMVKFPASGGFAMNAYRARPAGKQNLPVVLVVQEVFGVHEWIKDITRRFARAGYYAIAPDLFARQGDPTKVADIGQLVSTIVAKVPDAQVMADLDALIRFAGRDGGNAAKVGVTGFCWGGRATWLYAAHNPRIKAGVAWYGRLTSKPTALQPTVPLDLVQRINVPVLGLYGGKDRGIPVEDVNAMNAALAKARKPATIKLYPEADHGFLADYRPSYNAEAAKDGWAQAMGWFGKYLR
ncbi:MAG: dienelactone hydrolase family protein [Sphingomonadaceae bacterium]